MAVFVRDVTCVYHLSTVRCSGPTTPTRASSSRLTWTARRRCASSHTASSHRAVSLSTRARARARSTGRTSVPMVVRRVAWKPRSKYMYTSLIHRNIKQVCTCSYRPIFFCIDTDVCKIFKLILQRNSTERIHEIYRHIIDMHLLGFTFVLCCNFVKLSVAISVHNAERVHYPGHHRNYRLPCKIKKDHN